MARKLGVCMAICWALVAYALPIATATAKGTTMFTCASGGTKNFSDEHCQTAVNPGVGFWQHTPITNGTNTPTTMSNTGTANSTTEAEPISLSTTVAGVALEISCTTSTGSGSAENIEVGGAMQAKGTGVKFSMSGCSVVKPAGKGCAVKGGAFETKSLKYATFGNEIPEVMGMKFEPTEGTTFASFTVEGCTVVALNKSYNLEGTASASLTGPTIQIAVMAVDHTMTILGQAAGFRHTTTIRMSPIGGVTQSPISYTTG